MKTDLTRYLVNLWLVLSEVPGWPDAPLALRLRRAAPIFVALLLGVGLCGWKYGWRQPEQRTVRALHAPDVALDDEVELLRLACSDQQAVAIAEKAQVAAATLLGSEDDVPLMLRKLRDRLSAMGWNAMFQAYDSAHAEGSAIDGVAFATARGELVPATGNPAPFTSLLGVFNQISSGDTRIDLTRLGVRADESGKLVVELHLRIACRHENEKTS